jgi:hypothetical protein
MRGWEEIGLDLTSYSFKTCLEGIGLVDRRGSCYWRSGTVAASSIFIYLQFI